MKLEHTHAETVQMMHEMFYQDVNAFSYFTINRRKKGSSTWDNLFNYSMINKTNLAFTRYDYGAVAHQEYEYMVIINTTDGNKIYGEIISVTPEYSGFLFMDKEKAYVSHLDTKCTHQRDFNVAFIKPYNSRFPHAIRNGELNANTGTFEGIFNRLDEHCEFVKSYASFENTLIDFLSRGTNKIMKTPDGHLWSVQINTPITVGQADFEGAVKIQFSWTEVGEPAEMDMTSGVPR